MCKQVLTHHLLPPFFTTNSMTILFCPPPSSSSCIHCDHWINRIEQMKVAIIIVFYCPNICEWFLNVLGENMPL